MTGWTFLCHQHPGVRLQAGQSCHLCDAEEARRTVEAVCPRCKGSKWEALGRCIRVSCRRCGATGKTMVTPEEAGLV